MVWTVLLQKRKRFQGIMKSQNITKHNIVIFSYGIIVLIYSLFSLVTEIINESKILSVQWDLDLPNYFFAMTSISLFITPINFIVSYGLLRKRYWSRYAVIAIMATFPIHLMIKAMMWGTGGFHWKTILIPLSIVLITLFYFSSKQIRTLLDNPNAFRIKSWHGLLVISIILIAFTPLIFTTVIKIRFMRESHIPFFEEKPKVVTLQRQDESRLAGKYQKIRLLDTSMLVPKEFGIRKLRQVDDKSNSWICGLYNTDDFKKGFIMYGNKIPYDLGEMGIKKKIEEQAGITNMFDYERLILSNNWNPVLLIMKMLIRPNAEEFNIKELHSNSFKGFLKQWHRKDSHYAEFSLYSGDNKRFAGGTFLVKHEYLNDADVINILSTFEFLTPENPRDANSHYEKGLSLLQSGDFIQGQYELAEAYYLSPKNPVYILAFTKTLPKTGPNAYKNIKEMIDLILTIKPDYKDAQLLLKGIEPELQHELNTAK